MPGCGLRKVLVDFIIRDLGGDANSPYFDESGTLRHHVAAEVLARMSETKQVAVEMFAALEAKAKVKDATKSAVGHPIDNKNKCADYLKHGEGCPRCTAGQ